MSVRRDEDFTAYVQTRLAWLRRVGYLLCQHWQQADDLVQKIEITPGYNKCHFFQGSSSSQRVVLHGVTAILTHFAGDGARPYQGLCVPEAEGLHVMYVENPEPGSGGFAFGGVTGIYLHHLHLLGPDPANWTTHPLT